ncbi:MAG: DUF814 domain-containing protein [Chlorobi bacterium]|nr:DUF814 domain-containing protein [Chlorobiota bacterium]
MHRNYFTLYHAAGELHERLAGGFVFEIHSAEKNELTISFVTATGEHLQVVIVSRIPELSMFTREGLSRKKRGSATLLPGVQEREVAGVEMSPFDREILVRLAGGDTIVLRLYSPEANIFLAGGGTVADTCRSRNILPGQPYDESCGQSEPGILRQLELLAEDKARFIEHHPLPLPGFDRTMLRCLAERAGETGDPEALFRAFRDLFYELLDPLTQTGRTTEGKPLFSILHNPLPDTTPCSSVLEGLNRYSWSMRDWLRTKQARGELENRLLRQLRKTERELQEFDPEALVLKAGEDETLGHLLMGALRLERNEPGSITVPDIFNPGSADITIALKPECSLAENAAEYFRKAAKTRGKCATMMQRRSGLEKRKSRLESLLGELGTLCSPKAVRAFVDEYREELRESGRPARNAASRTSAPFRSVRLSASATLYIGKNAKNNDQLTFTFAKPNDIWLHARGSAGSHCVLRGVSMQHRDEIRKAAEIAARYSAAKHSELVPVMYTLKKYVRRSRHLPPGQVKVEREEVILVQPARDEP